MSRKGLRSSSPTPPDLLLRHPEFNTGVMGNLFGIDISGEFGIPNIAIIMFVAAIVAAFILNRTVARPLHLRARQQRGGGPPLGRQRRRLEDGRLHGLRPVRRPRRRPDRRARQLGPAGARLWLRARRHLGCRHRRHLARAAARARSSARSSAPSSSATLTNGLQIMSVPQEWQIVVTGVVVILAVYLDILRRRQQQ